LELAFGNEITRNPETWAERFDGITEYILAHVHPTTVDNYMSVAVGDMKS